ncbi:hypothetical protein CFP56_023182 [Quercus suber]|uniref:Uncharacterized protein n=1 Tax=Quercus suber TaxID=58331 RepID=A0AAW0LYE3_QUESU
MFWTLKLERGGTGPPPRRCSCRTCRSVAGAAAPELHAVVQGLVSLPTMLLVNYLGISFNDKRYYGACCVGRVLDWVILGGGELREGKVSIAFFLHASSYTMVMVEPLEELTSEQNPAKYRAYSWGKFITHRKRKDS